MLNLIITIVLIAICIFLINKNFNTQLVFLFMGLGLAFAITVVTKTSVANASSGNIYLDIFEALKETFISNFSSTGMSVIPIYAYSVYMNKINSSQVLGQLIARPIAHAKNPYFIGTFLAIMLCGLMRIAIVSAFAIMALVLTTLYPALTRAGMSRQSAIAAIFVGTCFDWGPADFVISQMTSGIEGFSVPDYFLNASIRVVPIVLIIVALLSGFVLQFIDKRSGYKFGEHRPDKEEEQTTEPLPKFYAVLPLLPLILILAFSPLFHTGISLSVMGAVVISVILVAVIEMLRKKQLRSCFNDILSWFTGMGTAFSNLLTLIICVQFFASMLGRLNGFTFLINTALNAGFNGYILLILFGLLMYMACLMLGDGGVMGITLAPQLLGIAASLGISPYAAILPMQLAYGARCINLGTSPHMQYVTRESQSKFNQILVRCAVPEFLMYALTFIFSLIIL